MSETNPSPDSSSDQVTVQEAPAESEPRPMPVESVLDLRLGRMEIRGFKSFSDKTVIEFPDGITAVVGPNGCGKSNIGDALNWVLGEQSAKMLRGSSMQDVIFSGTDARKPLGLAEVTLTLVSGNGSGPPARRDLQITRRLFRTGESEYRLNGARARLKDIQEVLRTAHVGAKTYATIEQGRIDQILNARPKDRRSIIEDAAGISGFKQKRRLAELKMEAARANLLRVHDIIVEVQRQINSLKRQASKARRYTRLREELRDKERLSFALRAETLQREVQALRAVESGARDAESQAAARLTKSEAELIAERANVEDADRAFRQDARHLHLLEAEIQSSEQRLAACREKVAEAEQTAQRLRREQAGLEERRARLLAESERHAESTRDGRVAVERIMADLGERQSELEALRQKLETSRAGVEEVRRRLFESMNELSAARNRVHAVQEALQRNSAQRSRVEQEQGTAHHALHERSEEWSSLTAEAHGSSSRVRELEQRHRAQREDAQSKRAAVSEATEDLSQAREREQSLRARLATLEDVATRFAGVSDGVRMLLSSAVDRGVRAQGVVADFVKAGREVEAAAELYLQGLLPAVLLEDDEQTARAARRLRDGQAGRTMLLSRTQPAGRPAVGQAGPLPGGLASDDRVLGPLRERLELRRSVNGALGGRIGEAVLVRDLDSALELHRGYPELDFLTPQGDVVYASGLVAVGGAPGADQGLLAHTRKMEDARAELQQATSQLLAAQERRDDLRGQLAAAERGEAELREQMEHERRRRVELELRVRQLEQERQRTRRQGEMLADELRVLREDSTRLGADSESARQQTERAEAAHRDLERQLQRGVTDLEHRETAVRELVEQTSGLRESLAAQRQLQSLAEQRAGELQQSLSDADARFQAIGAELDQCRQRTADAESLAQRTESALAEQLQQRQAHSAEVTRSERSIEERRRTVGALEETLRGLRNDLEERRQALAAAEIELTRADARRQHLDELCEQELGITAREARDSFEELDDSVELEQLEGQVAEIKEKIERVGPVNIMAIEEFTDLEQRYEFLSAQQTDLEQSMESLKETIRRINRSSRERFTEAFETIRRNYQEIFKVLFNGGRADLRLEEGEDVLECGIEILAQPPGKRLASVQLLSGGEKAMAAIALLFAIFRHQPSPFCLLDEVDAALDDLNVGRFTRMLHEYARDTQFVIVTHNKLSMEVADLLYGVTMEEPGVSRLVSLEL